MFRRHNVVDERDLTEAAVRLSGFLTDATRAAPTILPLATARRSRQAGAQAKEHGQFGRFLGCTDQSGSRK